MEEALRERCKAFASAYKSTKESQTSILASSVFAKTKAKTWHETCLSLFLESDPKVYSIQLFAPTLALLFSPPPPSPPPLISHLLFPMETVSVDANYLRAHFSVCQPTALL